MRKVVSFVLAMVFAICELNIVSVAVYDETDYLSLEKFTNSFVELISENDFVVSENAEVYYGSATHNSVVDDNTTEKEEKTNRLIVKSPEKLKPLDSVGYVYGYNDLHILQFDNRKSFEKAYEYYDSLKCVEYVEEDLYLSEAVVDDGVVIESAIDYPTIVQSNIFGYSSAKKNSDGYAVDIAVVDSGVQHDHDFLKGRVVDTGFNSISDNGTAYDDRGHGTHVAGIIVANTLSNVTVYAYKALNKSGSGTAAQVSLAIDAAIEDGMDVINLSVQMAGYSEALHDAVVRAYNAGITVVAAAGNKGVDIAQTQYSPGCFEEVISVMSCSNQRYISDFSNYGTPCDFAAPGENILSTYINNEYKITSGTSMASPFICAAVAYELAENNALSPDEVSANLSAQSQWCYGSPRGKCVYPGTKTTLSGKTETPVFELDSCGFIGSMTVSISCATANSDIFYAFDGASTYTKYTGPFSIDKTTTVSAFAISGSNNSSDTQSVKYTLVSGNASDYVVDETNTLIGYYGDGISLNIPSYIDGRRVSGVASSAFSGNKNIVNITFEETLTSIGENAFVGCDELLTITAPKCTEIGEGAFKGCQKFQRFTSASLRNIGAEAFMDCPVFNSFSNTENIVSVGDSAFENTKAFSLFSSGMLETIGNSAFKNSKISSVGISTATSVGDSAFYGCSLLTGVVLTNALTLGVSAFENCVKLTTVSATSAEQISDACFKGCVLLSSTQFGSVKTIGSYAFGDCGKVAKFNFVGVEVVKTHAFDGTTLSSVSSDTITTLEPYAFDNCWNLTSITLNGLKSVDFAMFEGASYVKNFTFNKATELIVPEGGIVKVCDNIASFTAPLLTALPDNTFNGCLELKTCATEKLSTVGKNAFCYTAITTLDFSNLSEIGAGAFSNMKQLTTVKINSRNIDITADMFLGDTAVKTVELNGVVSFPEGFYVKDMFPNIQSFTAKDAEELPDGMFSDCTSLATVTLPELYTIGEEVFKNCNLSNVVIYADDIGVNAFDGNPLTTARFDYLDKIECDIFGSSKSTLKDLKMMRLTDANGFNLSTFKSLENAEFDSLPAVPHDFFSGCISLKSVTLPAAKTIGYNAFYNCSALQIVSIDSAKSIGGNAFYNCKGLTEFYAESLEEIDSGVFDGCDNLTIISIDSVKTLPSGNGSACFGKLRALESFYADSVTSIPDNAFLNCLSLKTVSFKKATEIGDYAFKGTSLVDCTFGSIAHIGKYAFSGTAITDFSSATVENIGTGAFHNCSSLQKVTLKNITEIPAYAFYNTSNLVSATFDDVSSIGENAFAYCSKLTGFTYNRTPVEIGERAFYNCSAINPLIYVSPSSIGREAFYGSKQSASSAFELSDLKTVKSGAFDGVLCDTLILENVEEIYDVPENAKVLVGTDVKAGAIANDTTSTIYSPVGSVVSDYCIANGVNYVEFNEKNTITTNTPKYSVGYGTRFVFKAFGFNLKYNWYACNNEDGSDAVLIYSDVTQIAPFGTTGMKFDEWDYKYIFCVATSTENGNVVEIKSNMIRNTFTYVNTKNDKNELWYDSAGSMNGEIYSSEKSIDDFYANMYFEEGACEFIPSVTSGNNKLYGTGSAVDVYVNGSKSYTYTLILDGDVNGDGYVDALDCATVSSVANGKTIFTDDYQLIAATIFDGDYDVTVDDYQAIVNKAIS